MNASFHVAKKTASLLPNKRLQNLEDINFILHLSYLSDMLEIMNHCSCQAYLQGSESNIADIAITLTTSGVGEMRFANHKRFSDPRDMALQLFARNTKGFFCFAIALTSPISSSCVVEDFFCSFIPHLDFLLTNRWQLFDCSTFPQVALSMKVLPTLRLPSSKSSIHDFLEAGLPS